MLPPVQPDHHSKRFAGDYDQDNFAAATNFTVVVTKKVILMMSAI